MSHTLFISDLHLQHETPTITQAFLDFMRTQAVGADALYILGDLFETWIGDDDRTAFNQSIIDTIRRLAASGTPVYFMRGNRDFLIGQQFAQESAVQLLDDPTVIQLYGKPILLMHGDALCTLDSKHQTYRKIVQKSWIKKIFLNLPLAFRRFVAKYLRKKSAQHNLTAPAYRMDVALDEVQRQMKLHGVSLLIHGHTHRRAIHEMREDNKTAHRIVLGAWHEKGNALSYDDQGHYQWVDLS